MAIDLELGRLFLGNPPLKIWLNHRDLTQLIERSLASNAAFGIYYGVPNNRGRLWEIGDARLELGYELEDDASAYRRGDL